ncbi:pyridoxamine 5'-phosphate oxidase family protein [Microbacterium sp. EYE_5]|uniref:pyridoxamine 5'-phosphate oxidase family protein n=1 Tax=unclassified Microbacterium TaxID=2609290 RepID=UPI002003E909|nr:MULTISPECIES: pyridoxamine 5'-phosphate oxidase family protein [unclassified Microbacterium]MCK6081428.1 pyridoxamine 5'-phosphate oxidase family protein [Microbacterium sp. EYE_382]MCK6086698.1 pyridoxamine 5'-phosphate oxidase family protein [Microbacterium sp. EYE_384]MCK6123804.1 pyridoxamine 5'-phosphate oxidase family protein [Microbacterium sp. EYE_80]MCK6126713.1 pyridoxamine 5'-phosphate oxidase family protein [Microbacterium sp. EYE_79]MCK6142383.1 pyridoxamine 5'-phosphate oxidas
MATEKDPRATLIDLLPKFRFAMVTTTDEDGALTARPLTVQDREFDGDLWFIVARDSSFAAHIAQRPRVGVALSTNDAWVSLAGRAEIVDDPARLREYWSPAVEAWFPDGPEDPNITLAKIDAVSGEYWSSPGGVVASIVSLVKSKVTGEPYEGRNETVDL